MSANRSDIASRIFFSSVQATIRIVRQFQIAFMVHKIVTGKFAEIANRLRAVRHHFGLGSKEFAEQAGVAYKSYSQWESGDFRCSIDGAIRLCERYGVSLDFIYFGKLHTLPSNIAMEISSSPLLRVSDLVSPYSEDEEA